MDKLTLAATAIGSYAATYCALPESPIFNVCAIVGTLAYALNNAPSIYAKLISKKFNFKQSASLGAMSALAARAGMFPILSVIGVAISLATPHTNQPQPQAFLPQPIISRPDPRIGA